jgi:enolase-phosphatase E1
VTTGLRSAGIRVVLLDIEGTTTPIAFVHDVLFPFARARIPAWFQSRSPTDPDVTAIVDGLRAELDANPENHWNHTDDWTEARVVARLLTLMDQDRKSGPLKTLQGRIWEEGYARGELKGEVYPDVPTALERWTGARIDVGIFSSGSVLAQRLLFAHSNAGDLTRFLRWHFDTAIGAKIDEASYQRIVKTLAVPPSQVLFISDVVRELDAARAAGLETRLCVRLPADAPPASTHPIVRTLDEIPD